MLNNSMFCYHYQSENECLPVRQDSKRLVGGLNTVPRYLRASMSVSGDSEETQCQEVEDNDIWANFLAWFG